MYLAIIKFTQICNVGIKHKFTYLKSFLKLSIANHTAFVLSCKQVIELILSQIEIAVYFLQYG